MKNSSGVFKSFLEEMYGVSIWCGLYFSVTTGGYEKIIFGRGTKLTVESRKFDLILLPLQFILNVSR